MRKTTEFICSRRNTSSARMRLALCASLALLTGCSALHYAASETETLLSTTLRQAETGWSMEWSSSYGDNLAQSAAPMATPQAKGDLIGLEPQLCWVDKPAPESFPCGRPGAIPARLRETGSSAPAPLLAITVVESRVGEFKEGSHKAQIKRATAYIDLDAELAGRELEYGKLTVRIEAYPGPEAHAKIYLSMADKTTKSIPLPGSAPRYALRGPQLLATARLRPDIESVKAKTLLVPDIAPESSSPKKKEQLPLY